MSSEAKVIIQLCQCYGTLLLAPTAVYNSLIGDILNAMLGYVSLQDILQKIIQVRHSLAHTTVEHRL